MYIFEGFLLGGSFESEASQQMLVSRQINITKLLLCYNALVIGRGGGRGQDLIFRSNYSHFICKMLGMMSHSTGKKNAIVLTAI